ncbi:uncharacterized protein LOC131156505 isoform X2 [Malania oleifera]|uniref:uncharacterized protein LOC131156505 isoform X2 n=1 Tax=Malania oleifera TaxID=397392 RepID=UPI0025AE16A1|nr:uncharacterized protein LOC131156505 isoform X2 [Malania oleifera]
MPKAKALELSIHQSPGTCSALFGSSPIIFNTPFLVDSHPQEVKLQNIPPTLPNAKALELSSYRFIINFFSSDNGGVLRTQWARSMWEGAGRGPANQRRRLGLSHWKRLHDHDTWDPHPFLMKPGKRTIILFILLSLVLQSINIKRRGAFVDTPMELNVKFRKEKGDLLADLSLYRKLVGSLVYLTITRPDISFAVQQFYSTY